MSCCRVHSPFSPSRTCSMRCPCEHASLIVCVNTQTSSPRTRRRHCPSTCQCSLRRLRCEKYWFDACLWNAPPAVPFPHVMHAVLLVVNLPGSPRGRSFTTESCVRGPAFMPVCLGQQLLGAELESPVTDVRACLRSLDDPRFVAGGLISSWCRLPSSSGPGSKVFQSHLPAA